MKLPITSAALLILPCLSLVSCGHLDPEAQISLPSSSMNPLDRMSVNMVQHSSKSSSQANKPETVDGAYHVGDYVEVVMGGTPMHKSINGAVIKKMEAGTVLNVLGCGDAYMHVQNEEGVEGYVSVMQVLPQGLLMADVSMSDDDLAVTRVMEELEKEVKSDSNDETERVD